MITEIKIDKSISLHTKIDLIIDEKLTGFLVITPNIGYEWFSEYITDETYDTLIEPKIYDLIVFNELWVDNKYRNKGFGTKLINFAIEYVSKKLTKPTKILLYAQPFNNIENNNKNLLTFYEKFGFESLPIANELCYYNYDLFLTYDNNIQVKTLNLKQPI